jgi:hypothetical protein
MIQIIMTHDVTPLKLIRCEEESLCIPMTISISPNGSAAYSLIENKSRFDPACRRFLLKDAMSHKGSREMPILQRFKEDKVAPT